MVDESKAVAKEAAEAPAKVAEAIADTAADVAKDSAKTAKRVQAASARAARREAEATKTSAKRAAKATRRAARKTEARPAAAAASERKTQVTFDPNNIFAGFTAFPAAAPFQNLLSEANERSQEAVKRSQKVAEELADLTRANVEALVESSRIAVEGVRSLGQEVASKGRQNVEQAADAVRSLAEAKSPTEFIQLQSDFARSSFDRLVAESSKLTEQFVKLAGEAIRPISNRATANAERFTDLVA